MVCGACRASFPLLAEAQREGLLANFTSLAHNLRGVVIWGEHECFRDSNRASWRDLDDRGGSVARNRVVLHHGSAAGLHG